MNQARVDSQSLGGQQCDKKEQEITLSTEPHIVLSTCSFQIN